MKNFINYILILTAGITAACSSENEIVEQQPAVNDVQTPVTIKASYGDAGTTRVAYAESGSDISAIWEDGDQLYVVYNGHVNTLNLTGGAGTATGSFTGTITGAPSATALLICYVKDKNSPAGQVTVNADGSYTYTSDAFLGQNGDLDGAAKCNLYYGAAFYGTGDDISCTFSVNTSMMKFQVSAPDGVTRGATDATLTYMSGNTAISKATFTVGDGYDNTVYLSIPAGSYTGEQSLVYASGSKQVTRTLSDSRANFKAGQTYSKAINFSNATNLATLTADYTAHDGEWLSGTLAQNIEVSIADGATVTLRNVDISPVGTVELGDNHAGITCLGNATIILTDGTTNTVQGFLSDNPGIFVPSNKTLTIRGTGTLNAIGSKYGAGIGAGYFENCGNIVIEDGTINATGGSDMGAGIGGSDNTSCGNITITGGNVTATSQRGAGIGSGNGMHCYCGAITISGGIVNATGSGAGIGGDIQSHVGDIIITTDITSVTATRGEGASQPIGSGDSFGDCTKVKLGYAVAYKNDAWQFTIANGDYGHLTLAISNSDKTWTLTPATNTNSTDTKDISNSDVTVPNGNYWKVTGETSQPDAWTRANRLVLEDGAMVLLSDLTINGHNDLNYKWPAIECEGDAVIVLEGTNSVTGFYSNYPGIHVAVGHTLIIRGSGALTASSNGWGAGIGAGQYVPGSESIDCGNIRIEGGTVTAIGGSGAPGIGGAEDAACGDITITSGITHVTATKGTLKSHAPAASIGAGYNGTCGTVTIEDPSKVTQN